ncbi:hypothetical protein WS76_23260 [Burkholderia humptydooensis]|nr:hypothetical protein WS76_23260 [Burkholderia humptydooensis]
MRAARTARVVTMLGRERRHGAGTWRATRANSRFGRNADSSPRVPDRCRPGNRAATHQHGSRR